MVSAERAAALRKAVNVSAPGTFETCRLHRAMSAFESNPEDICSHWVLLSLVESRCGAVALGRTYLLPPLSSGGASIVPPWLRFHIPLIGRVEDWRAGRPLDRATFPVELSLIFGDGLAGQAAAVMG